MIPFSDLVMQIDPATHGFITAVGFALLLMMLVAAKIALPNSNGDKDLGFALLWILFGAVVGGLIGSLASPSEPTETDTFKSVAGVLSALVTGIVWTTFQTDIKAFVLGLSKKETATQIFSLCFLISIFLGGFTMYAYRVYGTSKDEAALVKQIDDIRKLLIKIQEHKT